MNHGKRPKLPRGLRWDPRSSYICFSWRDVRGSQHQQSTHTADPAEAMAFKLNFLREKKDVAQERKVQSEDRSRLPLEKAAELYFNWKAADISPRTIAREKRLFKSVEKFIGGKRTVRSIDLQLLEEYQEERRKQISPTMKKAVTARTVNYELRLLRGVMRYAKCWTGEFTEGYQPLRQKRRRVGRVATKEQLMKIIATAKNNEYWQLAMYCAAVAAGTGCRSWEIKNLRLEDIRLTAGTILIREEVAKNRQEREPCLMALAEWGLQELLYRARQLGAREPEHYLLPLNLRKSRHWSKKTKQKWDVTQPMLTGNRRFSASGAFAMSHASRSAHIADLIDDLTDLYLAQVADLREFAQATEAGEGTMHLEQALRQREIRRADFYRQFEQAAFSPAPIPVVAPNELDLTEDN